MNLKNAMRGMNRNLAILLSSICLYSSTVYAKDDAFVETEPSRLESYGEREDLLDENDYNVYNFRDWFKEDEDIRKRDRRAKIFLDFLSDYPEQQPKLKSGPFSRVFLSELEEELREDYFYLELTYHDYLLNSEEDYFNNNHNLMMDLEEDFGPMAANSLINAIVKKYKWARDLDKKVREIRDLTYVKGEYDGIKFKVGFSLDDDYSPMVELCLRGFPIFKKIEYKRSENQSEIEVRIAKNGKFEAALYSEKDFGNGDDKEDIKYDDKENIDYGAFARYRF